MADKSAKALDGAAVALNQKRKLAIQCLAHLPDVSTPTNLAVKQMKLVGNFGISRSLVQYYLDYKKSGLPKRLMFYKNGEWSDYPDDIVDLVKKDFEIKKANVEVELDGFSVVLDFLHMYNVNLKTGLQQPIGWIDEAGRYFFPEIVAGYDEESYNIDKEEDKESHGMEEVQELQVNLPVELKGAEESKLGENSGESNALAMDVDTDGDDTTYNVGNENDGAIASRDIDEELDDYVQLTYESLDEDTVKDIFLTGMTIFGINERDIVDIYWNFYYSTKERIELFMDQADITKEIHGEANVRYGWLACSKTELSRMVAYGLDYKAISLSKCIYGFGVHLAAVSHPYACVPYCDADKDGIKHLVLCRVIMGNMEPLRRGNNQICPSDCKYDNGVDDIECPKFYVVWNMNLDNHIIPEYVVSFKSPLDVEGNKLSNAIIKYVFGNTSSTLDTMPGVNSAVLPTNTRRGPRSPNLPFPMLFAAIRSKVPPKQMFLIRAHYREFRAKYISRQDLVMKLRLIVGDNILKSAINNLQYKGPSNDDQDGITENL